MFDWRRWQHTFVFVESIDVNVKMASNDEDLCTGHADFAVLCSFIDQFGEKLGFTLPNIGELQSSLEDTDNGKQIWPEISTFIYYDYTFGCGGGGTGCGTGGGTREG